MAWGRPHGVTLYLALTLTLTLALALTLTPTLTPTLTLTLTLTLNLTRCDICRAEKARLKQELAQLREQYGVAAPKQRGKQRAAAAASEAGEADEEAEEDDDGLGDGGGGLSADALQELEAAAKAFKAATWSYRSYNELSVHLYAQRYDWYIYSLPYVVLNKRTAISMSLARRIKRACTRYSNPTDLADELSSRKGEIFDTLRNQVYGMLLWASKVHG